MILQEIMVEIDFDSNVTRNCIVNAVFHVKDMYSARNLEMSIRFSLKSQLSERFHWPEMSQIKAEISLHSNVKLNFHKNLGWQGYQWIP